MRAHRHKLGVRPVFKRIDTCAAEFASPTAYMYSTYEVGDEAFPSKREKIIILGGGPTESAKASSSTTVAATPGFVPHYAGYEFIMVNCNPETVSTDDDTSDRLYFESLTAEDVLEIIHTEQSQGNLKGSDRPVRRSGKRRSSSPPHSKKPAFRSSARRPTRTLIWPKTATASPNCLKN